MKVLGGVSNNIGRNDEVNVYGEFNGIGFPLIDVLNYGDGDFPSSTAEGVTIDSQGNIYIVAENGSNPQLFKLSTVVIPSVSVPMP